MNGTPEVTEAQVDEVKEKLKDILREMETKEGIEKLKKGSLEFKIKPENGVMWYVAYGT